MINKNERGFEMKEIDRIVFELLLNSNGRTTDMLESICGDEIKVEVVKQEKKADKIYRESYLYTSFGNFIVSHNFMILYPDHVPVNFYQKVLEEEHVIGNILKADRLISSRNITERGWCLPNQTKDWDGIVKSLKFEPLSTRESIPYKQYDLHFFSTNNTGIKLLEYFNPEIIQYRLQNDPESLNVLERR
ncbi:hypothetical protein VKA52_15545 [Halobacillus sp. HZG1]|uniref:hypothetical protein n=1 Tax=Halobacillus sp. HZG1 TaxID=3111769 RepID=UPI002DBA5E13|nr:hypothetical protein [Halobacillus sp. HZG1]MEC3885147.1 hypothetical protein [Halobacillus sp. HZG1]